MYGDIFTDLLWPLNESPSEKEGKCFFSHCVVSSRDTLNESPSEKEGKLQCTLR